MSTQSEIKENEKVATNVASVESAQTVITKKKRRGINNDTRSTTRLKFDERRDMNKSNGLFVGHLDNVEIQWATIGEDANIQQFAGLAIPMLVLTFASNHESIAERRYVTHRMMPAESNALTIPGGAEAWKVDSVLGWMKHVIDVFVLKGRAMTEEEEDMLTLPFDDTDDDGNYAPVEAEEVINGWKVLFENFVKIINNEGKPYYKDAKGNYLPIWMKLLRFTKVKNVWRPVIGGKTTAGDLGFTAFVNEGCIELWFKDKAPLLKIDITKESVTYKETAKAPTAPAIPNVSAPMGGVPIMPSFSEQPVETSPFMATNPADEMPF